MVGGGSSGSNSNNMNGDFRRKGRVSKGRLDDEDKHSLPHPLAVFNKKPLGLETFGRMALS